MPDHPQFLPLYRALVEYAQDLLGVMDLQGQLRFLSPSAQDVLPGRREKWLQQDIVALAHPDDRRALQGWLTRVRRSGERELCEARLGHPERWTRLSLSGVRIPEDETHEVIVFSGHDITAQHAANQALVASEQRYHGAFDYAPIGKALLLSGGQIAEANRALADMLDCWLSELVGSGLFTRFDAEAQDLLRQDCDQMLLRRREVSERELSLRDSGGQMRYLLVNIAPIWDAEGALEHFIAQIIDITERRRAEQALRASNEDLQRSNEELKRFAFIASHDLKEPLRAIGSSIQLANRRYKDALGEDGVALLQTAVDGVKRLRSLMDDLQAYTEQMRGGEFERQAVSVSAVLRALVKAQAKRLEASGGEIHYADLPTVLGDPEQIRDVFAQLIDNALKFAAPDRPPRIEVSAAWERGQWHFCVQDNGRGIDPAHHEQIFEVFRRLQTDIEGTGMGLATVRKMVERHGGKIWVESAAGEGAAFHVLLAPE